ncbi:hypothetical protein, partial [Pseudomonas sp. GP01-A5]|uniref:hypothetical protein n=1 Tax=Pseudomonas sp. GP01-A5 TaxID=2070563 RepID=UPI001C46FFC1
TDTLNRLVTKVRTRSETRAAAAEASARAATVAAILATIATLVGVGAIAAVAVLGVRRAVGSIAGATGRLARGDTHIDLKALDR